MNAAEHLLGAAALERHGTRTALLCAGEAVGYAALAAEVRRAAGAWLRLGAHRGDRVLILLRDTPEFAAAWLGALYCGAVAIAVNGKTANEDLRHMFEDSAGRLFLAEAESFPGVSGFAGDRAVELGRWRDALRSADPKPQPADMAPHDPAFWLFSSGTTGRPKGIVHSHKDVLPAGSGMRQVLGLSAGDTVFGTSKLFFAYGLEHALLGPLALGAASILHPDSVEAAQAAGIVARHRPAAFFSVPSFYRRLLALPAEALAPFRAVRHFVAAGERLPAQVLDKWAEATGCEILSLYGMSETFCAAMMTPPGTSNAARTGLPLAGVDTRLLDAAGAEVAAGEPGTLWVRHPSLATGYANRPDATREQFVDGWFCTKDIFVRDSDGYFSHQGRGDDFIKVAGQWVQPGELEEAALSDPMIAEAACVRVNDADGFERLALFVTSGAAPETAIPAATRACELGLPRHKRPKWVRMVAELPRTATGKLQRYRLRELLERELAGKD
ncbi:MAG: AMP-binding protein [Proteobacteria bacterium]|nr:AMP-binding protein [Pseudomonadota bacterium]